MPVLVRIEELCIREYMCTVLRDDALNLRILLRSVSILHNKFTPMSYIKYVSKDFQEALNSNNSEDSNSENVVSQCAILSERYRLQWQLVPASVWSESIVHCHWQSKWNITDSGRSTYELVPIVSQKPQMPRCRNTAVSFVRILLHESHLHRQPYRQTAS